VYIDSLAYSTICSSVQVDEVYGSNVRMVRSRPPAGEPSEVE
jgi:hypothetical protein